MEASTITTTTELLSLLFTHIPAISQIFWMITIVIIVFITFKASISFLSNMVIYLSLIYDNYTHIGTCVEYRGFYGFIKKIKPTYILLQSVPNPDEKHRAFRKIPLVNWAAWHKDFYEHECDCRPCSEDKKE